jgi:ATP-dependent DNA helicase RecG
MWRKTANSREEMPEYVERSYHEALVNALAHRDYLVNGSEVHIDIYDDRLTIYSPGGMPDGTRIQNGNLFSGWNARWFSDSRKRSVNGTFD